MVYGGNIDNAATESGKPYSELPNAFRYRNELVAGCSCNGKDPIGLAPVKIDKDPTLRKGDIVAGANGLVVASEEREARRVAGILAGIRAAIKRASAHPPVVAQGARRLTKRQPEYGSR